MSTEVSIEDQLAKGSKLSFDTMFAPQTGYLLFSEQHLFSIIK